MLGIRIRKQSQVNAQQAFGFLNWESGHARGRRVGRGAVGKRAHGPGSLKGYRGTPAHLQEGMGGSGGTEPGDADSRVRSWAVVIKRSRENDMKGKQGRMTEEEH